MVNEELEHMQQLLYTHTTRLRFLELEAARKGIDTPPHVAAEIVDLKKQIVMLNAQLGIESNQDSTIKPPTKTQEVQLILNGNFADLTPEIRDATIRALAAILNISQNQVKVLKVMSGSIIYNIELPTEALKRFIMLYISEDELLKELGVLSIQSIHQTDDNINFVLNKPQKEDDDDINIYNLIESLPNVYRDIVKLTYIYDWGPTEIGKLMDIPAFRIRVMKTRAVQKLRKSIQEIEDKSSYPPT